MYYSQEFLADPWKELWKIQKKDFFLPNAFTILYQTLHNIGKDLKILVIVGKGSDRADTLIKDHNYTSLQIFTKVFVL